MQRDREKYDRLQQKFWREMGDTLSQWLHDPMVIEVMLNADGKLWYVHQDNGLCHKGDKMHATQAMNLIGTVANLNETVANENQPILECALPFIGHRFEAVLPPVVESPAFCIRKRANKIFTLANYVHEGMLTQEQAECLKIAIKNRQTILVVGGPGTGKTTFANALLDEMVKQSPQYERILILEDTRELQSTAANTLFLQTTENIGFTQLLRAALRLRPDKICMGECRGAEMLTLLKSWNTGTPGGLATLHANSAKAALIRIQEMVAESGSFPQPQLIAEAVNVIVSLAFHPTKGRIVTDILKVTGYKNQDFQFQSLLSGSLSTCSMATRH